jgi:hypothetical protein
LCTFLYGKRQGDVWYKIKLGWIIDETREKIENLTQTGFADLHFEGVQNVACDVGFLPWSWLFKNDYFKDKYFSVNMPRKYNNSFAKLRCGVAPLKIETGRTFLPHILSSQTVIGSSVHFNECK